jgi:outer membrane protein TolC
MSKRIFIIFAILLINVSLFAQDTKQNNKKEASISIGGAALSLEQAIDIVIKQNLTLQSAKYDIVMSDTAYEKAQKKYATNLNIEGGYFNQELPPSKTTTLSGTKQWQYDAGISLSKIFSTGTTISAGVKEVFYDANDKEILGQMPYFANPDGTLRYRSYTQYPEDPGYHKPVLFASIQQELLKNAFGVSDRRQNKMLQNQTEMQRAALINMLSGLVVSTLVDYWTITIQKSAMDTAQAALESNTRVRGIIMRNAGFGLSEQYELNQYNSLVASSDANLQAAKQRYREAVRKLLRTIDMPPETEVSGVTDLVDELPALDPEAALKTGFEKRVDHKNALLTLENAKTELAMQENNALPSLTVSLGVSSQGQDTNIGTAFNQAATYEYPAWQARAKLSYPLDDSDMKASVRNAYLKQKQAELNLKSLKLEIRDDIINRMEQVTSQHQMLINSHTASREADLYYKNVLKRFEQGKVNSVTMKLAIDAMVQSRYQALNSLVQYNISLLLFDLSKNEVFDRYHVDVEKYLKNIKE